MNNKTQKKIKTIISEAITTKAQLLYDDILIKNIESASAAIVKSLKNGGKALIFGNGGSAADSQHFAAELVGRFQKERTAIAALSLTTDTSVLTSLANDYDFDLVFKRQMEALAKPKDIVIALSTSGNSKNVLEALRLAKKMKLVTIGLTGQNKSRLGEEADIVLVAPSNVTARIQEIHILLIHILCQLIEEATH